MASNKKTVFNKLWTDKKLFPDLADWVEDVKGSSSEANCKFCQVSINLSNMGRQALSSHAAGAKHRKYIQLRKDVGHNQCRMTSFLCQSAAHCQPNITGTVQPADCQTNLPGSTVSQLLTTSSIEAASTVSSPEAATSQNPPAPCNDTKGDKGRSIVGFVSGDEVTKAEILWAMKCMMSHYSYNSSSDMKDILKMMFPDSGIAKKMSIGSTKMSYYITYGLGPFYHNNLLQEINGCSDIVVCFDEAMNRISQRGQMDIIVRFWGKNDFVSTRYFGSAFMGHCTSDDLLASFKTVLAAVPLSSLLQVSMDGPTVNWKFMDLLAKDMEQEHCLPKMLNMGSCALHVVHGAFQTGHKASGWEVNAYLRAMFGAFKDSPARRADFRAITGNSKFPLKFCQVRWVENVTVAQRALELLPDVCKYVSETKKLPNNVTCDNLKALCSDKLASVKISFFASVASVCEPFLKQYQTTEPLAPFLYDDIEHLLRQLMKRFVKKSLLKEADSVTKLVRIDVTAKDNRCSYKDVDIGVAATKDLATSSLSDLERMKFRMQCTEFLSATVVKLLERCPVKYGIVRAISCLVPSTIANNQTLAEKRMTDLVQTLYETNHISAVTADTAKSQFAALMVDAKSKFREHFAQFNRSKDRLDKFYVNLIGSSPEYADLLSVIRSILILSHGNAAVESGFSINSDFLVDNLHEDSLVAQRTVYDAVKASGGVTAVNINRAMLQYVRGSNARYKDALERKRKQSGEQSQRAAEKKRAKIDIDNLHAKKAKLEQEAAVESRKIDYEIAELEKKHK